MITKDRYKPVEPPTGTEAEKQAAIDYWLRRHREAVTALGVSVTRLTQLGVPIPEIEFDGRMDVI